MEYINLLKNWKLYQYEKRMAMALLCSFENHEVSVDNMLLTFTQEDNGYLQIKKTYGRSETIYKTPVDSILGYNINDFKIIINIIDMPAPWILTFPNENSFSLALSQLRTFLREDVNVPTPPSSSENSD